MSLVFGDLLHLWGKNFWDDSSANDRTNDSELMERFRAVISTLDVAVCFSDIGRGVIHDMLDVPLTWEAGVKSGSTPVGGPVKSGRKRTKDKGKGAGQQVSLAGVGDRLDSTTKDNKRWSLA